MRWRSVPPRCLRSSDIACSCCGSAGGLRSARLHQARQDTGRGRSSSGARCCRRRPTGCPTIRALTNQGRAMAHHEPSRRRTLAALAVWVAAPRLVSAQGNEAPRGLRAVIQVSDNDPQKWHLALNNARNALDELGTREAIELEIVVYGPGIGMLKMDSTVANRVAEALAAGVHVVACENTMRAQKLTQADMLPRIGYV